MSLIYVLFLAGLGFLLERLSGKKTFDRLHHQLTTSKSVLECGEPFALTTTITNGKPRPVLFLHLEENVPDGLVLLDKDSPEMRAVLDRFNKRRVSLHQTLYLMPRQKVTRTVHCSLPRRGRYVLHDGKMEVGDLLGLEANVMQLSYFRELVVLPKRVECPSIEAAFGSYLGDISVRRFILEDPVLTAGFREYTGREPMRDISWPISLRQNKLMVKQYDYTSELTASVLFNIAGGTIEEKELGYSYARCACEFLEGKRVSYSFLTNAYVTSSTGHWTFLGEGLGDSHLAAILEGLGRGSYEHIGSLKKLLNSLLSQPDRSRAFILVTVPLSEADYACLKNFENRTGISFFVITADAVKTEADANGTAAEAAGDAIKIKHAETANAAGDAIKIKYAETANAAGDVIKRAETENAADDAITIKASEQTKNVASCKSFGITELYDNNHTDCSSYDRRETTV